MDSSVLAGIILTGDLQSPGGGAKVTSKVGKRELGSASMYSLVLSLFASLTHKKSAHFALGVPRS